MPFPSHAWSTPYDDHNPPTAVSRIVVTSIPLHVETLAQRLRHGGGRTRSICRSIKLKRKRTSNVPEHMPDLLSVSLSRMNNLTLIGAGLMSIPRRYLSTLVRFSVKRVDYGNYASACPYSTSAERLLWGCCTSMSCGRSHQETQERVSGYINLAYPPLKDPHSVSFPGASGQDQSSALHVQSNNGPSCRYPLCPLSLSRRGAFAQSAPNTPINSQAGLLHFPTFDSKITAVAPIYGGTGEEIYYSDITAEIEIPTNVVGLGNLFGASQIQANVTINLDLENASPSTIQAYSGTINNIPFQPFQVSYINIPSSGVLAPVGPITLGDAGTIHRIQLGEISVNIAFQNSTGGQIGIPIPVTCGQQNIDYVIGSVQINSTTGLEPLQPTATGLTYPTTSDSAESGALPHPIRLRLWLLPMDNLSSVCPTKSCMSPKIGWPNTTAFDTTVTNLQFEFSNASPSSLNVASTPISTDVSIEGVTSDLIIPIPGGGDFLTIGPFTAGAAGTIASFQIGVVNATTNLVDSEGNVQYSLDVSCQVPFELNLGA
ncbi:hypothetical protein MRB53_041028 [Persea americana]|nr:hypothetical protein MRB53_041028 [Persea americana]